MQIWYHNHSINQLPPHPFPPLPLPSKHLVPLVPIFPDLLLHLLPNPLQIRRNVLHLHTRCALQIPQLLRHALHQPFEILLTIPVLVPTVFAQRREKRLVRREVVQEGRVCGEGFVQLGVDADACFVRP